MSSLSAVSLPALVLTIVACSGSSEAPSGPNGQTPASVTITPSSATLRGVGSTLDLSASVRAADGVEINGVDPTWSSGAPNVATLSTSGRSAAVTVVAPGTAVITASVGNIHGIAQIVVEPIVRSVIIDTPPATMEPGEQLLLKGTVTADPGLATTVTWTSSAANIITVTRAGQATAVAKGEAVLTATADADTTKRAAATIRVDVYHAATRFVPSQFLPGSFPGIAVTGLWNGAGSRYLAATDDGSVYSYDGTAWLRVLQPVMHENLQGPETFYAFDATGPDDIWAVGSHSAIAHFDGNTWTRSGQNVPWGLTSIWANSRSDAWAAGHWGTMLRYDGVRWNQIVSDWTGSTSSVSTGEYRSIWGAGPNAVYAAKLGYGQPALRRFDGLVWSDVTLPALVGYNATIVDHVTGSGLSDVYAVMRFGPILHYDGSAWRQIPGPGGSRYECGFGMNGRTGAAEMLAACDVAGVGGRLFEMGSGSILSNRALPRPSEPPMAVHGRPDGSAIVGYSDGVTFAWQGGSWRMISASPHLFRARMKGTDGVLATAGDQIAEWNGQSWSLTPLNTNSGVAGLWVSSPTLAYAVGYESSIFRFDGIHWTQVPGPDSYTAFFGVWGAAPNDVWVVGGEYGTPAIAHFNGASWADASPSVSGEFYAVWGSGARDVFAVGSRGLIMHFDGTSWTRMEIPSSTSLYDVWGSGPGDVYAVGSWGVIFHYDGTSWTTVRAIGSGPTLYGIWGSGPKDLYAVGDGPSLFLSEDGHAWNPVALSGINVSLGGVTGTRAGGLWAVGSNGFTLRGTRN